MNESTKHLLVKKVHSELNTCKMIVHRVLSLSQVSYKLTVKGVLHPWLISWLFMHFSQKLQHIGDKWDVFHIGSIPRNQITALEFHQLKWLLIHSSKHGKYWFSHILYSYLTTMVSTEVKLWFFEFLGTFLTRSIGYFVQNCFIFLRKCTQS